MTMSEVILEVSPSLWVVIEDVPPEYDDGLLTLRDDTGGNTLIDKEAISALIAVLQRVQRGTWKVEKVEDGRQACP
jgi:hypothetical protein